MKKGILFTILIMLLMPIMVFADDNVTTEITGVSNGKPGDIVAYDINITVPENLKASGYKATLDYNKDVLDLKTITAKDWEGTNNKEELNYTYTDGVSGTTTIATITFKIKDTVSKQNVVISLKDISITVLDEEDSSSIVSNFDETSPLLRASLSIKSTDNTLKSLQVGDNPVEKFSSDVTEYTINVAADQSEVEIKATPNNANAKFVEGFGNRKITLNYGENEVLVKVESEIGEVKTYTLTIIREDDRNTNNNLKEVIINSGKIKLNLSKNRVDYTVQTYKLKSLDIDAVAEDPNAKISINKPSEIIIGDNVVVITVTSEMGIDKVYTIVFENSNESIDTKIKTLYVSGVDIDFDKNTMVYKVPYNKKYKNGLDLKVVTVSDDNLVTYNVYYNDQIITDDIKINLQVGDVYEIVVTPLGMEEGDESEATVYTIEITKDNRVSFYFLLEIILILILMVLIIVQIVLKKKNNTSKTIVKEPKEKHNTKTTEELQKEIDKTKIIDDDELQKINDESKK